MASLSNDGGRSWRIQVGADAGRKTIRFRGANRDAERFRDRVERLAASWPSVPADLVEWLDEQPDKIHKKLAKAGIAKPRKSTAKALGAFVESYLSQRGDVKPGTMMVFHQAKRWLVRFMGENKPLSEVTPADADAFRAHMLGAGRARATVNKWCSYARHFFEVAKRRRLIDANPFEHIKGSVRGNAARRVLIPASDAQKVIDAAPDPQWKLLIALARWGGLRIPSEALALKWPDIDWERNRFTVHASKTEHHADGGIRIAPIFPELLPHMREVFEAAEPGAVHVITKYRNPAANLRTQLVRYITAAGLKPWPKPWQNMRSTRATELADCFPSHVCAAWLGHTEAVANEFYRQITDEHFERASAPPREAAQKAAHFPAQYGAKLSEMECKQEHHTMQDSPENTAGCAPLHTLTDTLLGAERFELSTKGL